MITDLNLEAFQSQSIWKHFSNVDLEAFWSCFSKFQYYQETSKSILDGFLLSDPTNTTDNFNESIPSFSTLDDPDDHILEMNSVLSAF